MSMTILSFDTSGPYCAACVLQDGEVRATTVEEMSRGQAERLMPMLEELLSSQTLTWQDLTAIGVGIGPGNFTGIRISVSAARGLALGLDAPAIGVSSFDALRLGTIGAAAVPAPRDMAYLAVNDDAPLQVPLADLPPDTAQPKDPTQLVINIAQMAARATPPFTAPAPLYVRPADAAPPRDAPPVILDDA